MSNVLITVNCFADDFHRFCVAIINMMIRRRFLLALEYHSKDVPANGSAVLGSLAAPVKHKNKDAAGHIFHEYALRQSGVLGKHCYSLT